MSNLETSILNAGNTGVVETPAADAVTQAANATVQQTQPVESDRDRQNRELYEQVVAAAVVLKNGFQPVTRGRKKDGPNYANDQLFRTVIQRLAADVAPEAIDDENIGKDVFKQGAAILSALCNPQTIDERVNAFAEGLKKRLRALGMCNSVRHTFKHNIPALQYGMAYVGYAGKKQDFQLTMLNALPTKGE